MSRTTHDYDKLRKEYIQSDITIRQLCRDHGIKSWSTVNARKNAEDWDAQREEFRSQYAEREVAILTERHLKDIASIHSELLLAIRHSVRRYVNDVAVGGPQTVSARDLMGLIDKFLLLTGQATSRSESKNLDISHTTFDAILRDAPPELLRELAELGHDRGAGAKPVGRGPLVVLEGASA